MKKIALIAVAMMLIFAGCRNLGDVSESTQSTVSQQETGSSQGQMTANTKSGGTDSSSKQTTASTTAVKGNSKDINEVQSQLNELENVLKDLDDVTDSDLQIPES